MQMDNKNFLIYKTKSKNAEIFMLRFGIMGTNCYIVHSDGEIMIIDSSAFYGEEKLFLLKFINKLSGNLKFIVNTHGHFDHIASNDFLKNNFPDAKLLIHFADSEKLTSPLKNRSAEFSLNVTSRQADKLLKENDKIALGNASFIVIHTPGHTKGSIAIFGEGLLFSGDTLFAGTVGTAKEYKNAYHEMIRSIKEKLLTLPDKTVILPGHMEISTIEEEKSLNPFIR